MPIEPADELRAALSMVEEALRARAPEHMPPLGSLGVRGREIGESLAIAIRKLADERDKLKGAG